MTARAAVLSQALDQVIGGDAHAAVATCAATLAESGDAWFEALGSVMSFLASDFETAIASADRALGLRRTTQPDSPDPELTLLAHAARGLAVAGSTTERRWTDTAPDLTATGDPLADALAWLDLVDSSSGTGAFATYLVAEAALANGRLELAARIVARTGPVPLDFLADSAGNPHEYLVVMRIMRVRLLAFRGRITDAIREHDELEVSAGAPPLVALLIAATESLVRGNAAERSEVRALADRLELARPEPRDYLSAGCYLLAAFGLVAVGDVRRAARLVLLAGGDAALGRYTMIDRGLAFELLVAAAALEGDLDAADSWRAQAEDLRDTPTANSTVARLISRVELLRGRPAEAVEWADRGVQMARVEGRVVEVAEGEIVGSRARIAASQAGEASTHLEAMVVDAEESGHLSARRAAARELRAAGRRLRPPAGSEWSGLSLRERDIAIMVAEGLGNRDIALDLHLSEHTVRAHVSRVLAAFGAASRFAVAARVAEMFPDAPSPQPSALTPRQNSVAELIARGAGNAEIGLQLDLSVKTVEKHIGEIFRRWNVTSRVGIARVVRAATADEGRQTAL